jgi:hypothetical protein
MSAKSKKFMVFIASAFVSLLVACNITPSGVQNLFASFGSTATNTPTITATPLPPLDLSRCPIRSACPTIPDLISFSESGQINSGTESSIQFQYDEPVRVSLAWTASDLKKLEENMSQITFFFKIDGVPYDDPTMFQYGYILDAQGNATTTPGYFMGVILSNWKLGIPHTIDYGYIIHSQLNNGLKDYQPQTVEYTILAMPLNFPTPTFTPTLTLTATPLPTDTPWPTDTLEPLPTDVPVYPTSSCSKDGQIQITNSTEATVTLYLSGPADYTFYLGTGDTTLYVCPGEYSYTAYGCGGASDTGTIDSGSSHEFYCTSN